MVGGSPCQDFSVAGKQKGAEWNCQDCKHKYNPLEVHHSKRDKCPKCESINIEKTRSSLVVEWLRVLSEKKPNLAMYENVKNLVGKKHKYFFDLFIAELHEYGYNTYWEILNAKDYGIPQNRERVYLIVIKKELDNGQFKFPVGFDNGIRLKDILEDIVDKKYYISQEKTDKLIEQLKNKNLNQDNNKILQVGMLDIKGNEQVRRVYDPDGLSPTLNSMQGGNRQPKILEENELRLIGGIDTTNKWIKNDKDLSRNYKEGYRVYDSDGIACCQKSNGGGIGSYTGLYSIRGCSTRTRNYVGQPEQLEVRRDELSNSITTVQKDSMVIEQNEPTYRIRKLIPLECFRLMGFEDNDFYTAQKGLNETFYKGKDRSSSQFYKMAGNSIVVDVLYYILLELYKAMPYLLEDIKLSSFFSGIGAFEKAILRLQEVVNKDN